MIRVGEGNGIPLQYSCLENPMDGGAWWAAVHGVTTSLTRLSDFTFTFHFHALEEEMATHSSVLAWRIPGTGEPGGLPSMGSQSQTRLKRLSSMIGVSIGLAQNLSLLSSPISPFCSGNVMSYDCPTIVRWKHITCLISQSHSWRAVCLRMKISRVSFISDLDDILVRLQNLGF